MLIIVVILIERSEEGSARMTTNRSFYVYMLMSDTGTVYVGVTNDLDRRVAEHRAGKGSAFTTKYNIHRLVYRMEFDAIVDAIALEKRIKGWIRAKKIDLIRSANPTFRDLAE